MQTAFRTIGMSVIMVACVADDPGDRADTSDTALAPARCPSGGQPEQVGTVTAAVPTEASGLAWVEGMLWTHDDSGGSPQLFALAPDGSPQATLTVDGVVQRDWEDLAVWRDTTAPTRTTLVVGDIGDNLAARSWVQLVLADLPSSIADQSVAGRTLNARYPDGPRDAEALLVDDTDASFWVLSKSFDGITGVYRGSLTSSEPEQVLTRVTTLTFGEPPLTGDKLVTAADVDPLGRGVIVRTYLNLWWFPKRPDQRLEEAFFATPCTLLSPAEPQGEAVALGADAVWTLSEGSQQPIWRVPLTFP